MKKKIRRAGIIGSVAAISIGSAAYADSITYTKGNAPDNGDHSVYIDPSVTGYRYSAVAHGIAQLDRVTTLNVHAGSSWTDVKAQIVDISPYAGLFTCVDHNWLPIYNCDHSTASLNVNVPNSSAELGYLRALWCHEIGHSGGIGERDLTSITCMRNPATSGYQSLGTDEVNYLSSINF